MPEIATAVLDANVLYPAPLRDFLLWAAKYRFYLPVWSDEIQDEWARNLLENRPDLTSANILYTQNRMNAAFPAALITGYEHHVPLLTNHEKDRHVLAAAIQAKAACIVTLNLKDFQPADLAPHGVQAIHPDTFALSLYQSDPEGLVEMIQRHRASLKRPPKTAQEYLDTLQQNQLTQTAATLQGHATEL